MPPKENNEEANTNKSRNMSRNKKYLCVLKIGRNNKLMYFANMILKVYAVGMKEVLQAQDGCNTIWPSLAFCLICVAVLT